MFLLLPERTDASKQATLRDVSEMRLQWNDLVNNGALMGIEA